MRVERSTLSIGLQLLSIFLWGFLGVGNWINSILSIPDWFAPVWTSLFMMFVIDIPSLMGEKKFGVFSLGMSLDGKDKVVYWLSLFLGFLALALGLKIKDSYDLSFFMNLIGLFLILLIWLAPILLFGSSELKQKAFKGR